MVRRSSTGYENREAEPRFAGGRYVPHKRNMGGEGEKNPGQLLRMPKKLKQNTNTEAEFPLRKRPKNGV